MKVCGEICCIFLFLAFSVHCPLFTVHSSHADDLIFGIYNTPGGKFSEVAAMGLNTVVTNPYPELLDEAESCGLRAIVNIPPDPGMDTRWVGRIKQFRRHPALYAWALFDEPDINRRSETEVAAAYAAIKKLDPDHPVYVTVYHPRAFRTYAPYCDIFAANPYVVTKKEPLTPEDIQMVNGIVRSARKAAGDKPVFAVIQSFAGHPWWPRPPTPVELTGMVSASLAGGAKGILFYAYRSSEPWPLPSDTDSGWQITSDTPLVETIRRLAKMYKSPPAAPVKPQPAHR